MKRTILFLIVHLCVAFSLAAQIPIGSTYSPSGPPNLNPGWTYLQNTLPIKNGNSLCTSSPCTFTVLPTTAGTGIYVDTITANNVSISSITNNSGTGSFSHATGCTLPLVNTGNDVMDAYYSTNIQAGSTSFTITMSGAVGSFFYVGFHEALPPSGYTASYDTCAGFTATSSTCSVSCNGVSITAAQTDAIFVAVDSSGAVTNSLSSPFFMDYVGDYYAMNAPSGTNTLSSGGFQASTGYWTQLAVAFKSSANGFTTNSPNFKVVNNGAVQFQPGNVFVFAPVTCNPTCDLTLTNSTGSGNLGFLQEMSTTNTQTISAIGWTGTNGGTWNIHSGASTCVVSQSGLGQLGCAHILSLNSGGTKIHVTMSANGTYNFAYYEVNRTTGSFALDSENSAYNSSASLTPPGVGLTLSGTNDACFQLIADNQSPNYLGTINFYPGPGGNATMGSSAETAYYLNLANGTQPTWLFQGSGTSIVSGVCFK